MNCMGKGRYWPLQNKPAQIPGPLKIPGAKKQEAAVKEATKYLLQKTVAACQASVNKQ